MKQSLQSVKTKKKRLCIILGGPPQLLKQRIRKTLQNINPDQYDFIFTGFRWELQICSRTIQKDFPEIWKRIHNRIIFIESFNTWNNLEVSQAIWKKYETILIYTGYFHGRRAERFLELLGYKGKLCFFNSGEKESIFARFFCWFESSPQRIKFMTKVARFFRKSQLSSQK